MKKTSSLDAYGALTDPATLRIQRLLPGPIERIWSYLTDGDLRRQWLAAGPMEMEVGAAFEFVWRNDELTDPPGDRPEQYSGEHRMASRITRLDPPRLIAFTWDGSGDVSIELEPRGDEVLLTLVHRGLPDRKTVLSVGPGWHAHLDVLVARAKGAEPEPFWDAWLRLKEEYGRRLSA